MICPNCGNQVPDNMPFCDRCGARMPAPAPQPPYSAPQPTYGAPQPPVYPPMPVKIPGKGQGIASMVLGIVALVLFCIWYISIPCAVVGLILGGVSIHEAKTVGAKNGMAVAGLVCSAIAIAICLIVLIFAGAVYAEILSYM